jgi:hypothetical protein
LFALLVVVALFVLLWKLRDTPPRTAHPGRPAPRPPVPPRRRPARPARPVRSVAPDDDPEFLRELSRRMRRDKPDA